MKKNFTLPPLQQATPPMSHVPPAVKQLNHPPPLHLPPVPLDTSTPTKQKKKKKHKKDKKGKHSNEVDHKDQANGDVPKPDVISGTSAIELEEDYGEGSLYTPRELPSLNYAPASTSFIVDRALALDQGDVPTQPPARYYKRPY